MSAAGGRLLEVDSLQVQFFTRAGMGRCQGGFCTYHLMRVLLRETGGAPETITKRGGKSALIERTL